jgi:coenzyme F420-dependent oxidoreductase
MAEDVTLDLAVTPPRDSIEYVAEQAQLAESYGFTYASMGEVNGWNVVPVLTMIAERTSDLGITNDVFSPYSRSPALLAQTALTLQEASGGRYRLGVGTSSPAIVEQWHGDDFDRPLRRVREAIEIIRQITAGERLDYDGEIFEVGGQQYRRTIPDTPLHIDVSALGPKTVEMTGRFADGWIPQMFTTDGIRDRLDDLRRGADLGNRDPSEVRVSPLVRCFAHEDAVHARDVARDMVSFLIGAYGPYYGNSLAAQGYEDMVEAVRSAWADGDTEGMVEAVPDSVLDELVAAGTPEEVKDFVERYAAVDGVSAVRTGFIDGMDEQEQRQTLEVLAELI